MVNNLSESFADKETIRNFAARFMGVNFLNNI